MKSKRVIKCEICGNKDFVLIATKIREGKGRILKCGSCGLIIQDIGWSSAKLKEYYEHEYQRTNSLVAGRTQTPAEHFKDRLSTIGPVFEGIKHLLKPDSNVLEVGCGAGSLLSLIKPHVANCVGIEAYTPFVDFINNELGIEAHAIDLAKLNSKVHFDIIISIATLDHIPNPCSTLLAMRGRLSKSGKIYIEVPSCEQALNLYLPSKMKEKFNEFFWHRAHLFYFDRSTISALFDKCGLSVSMTCRHDYTLKNFLKWYFTGRPQTSLVSGMSETGLFSGRSDFESRMNKMFELMEKDFKKIMAETFRGESFCCIGTSKGERPKK